MAVTVLQIGAVRRAHGLRGHVRVQLHDPGSLALTALPQIFLGPNATDPDPQTLRSFTLTEARPVGGGAYLVGLAGVGDRTAAEALHGLSVYAARDQLPPPDPDEVFLSDLIGLAVQLPDGTSVGTIESIEQPGGQDLLVVARPGRPPALVPCVPEILQRVDFEAGLAVIDPPEGLLDLDRDSGKPAKAESSA